MKITTIVFAYHRYEHVKKVLDALGENTVLPERLVIFQDGKKNSTNIEGWRKVNSLIQSINFCPTEVIVADVNKGLALSIMDGVNFAFKDSDAVIVLEDDCVPLPSFMRYMVMALNYYIDINEVQHISGYNWPANLCSDSYDAYFNGRACSWGWGTWKRAWMGFDRNPNLLNILRNNKEYSLLTARWGRDLMFMLQDSLNNKNDTWAVYWGLEIIKNKGLCLNPYKSLIKNIGFDGSGVHCGTNTCFDAEVYESDEKNNFILPDKIEIKESTVLAFIDWFGSYTLETSYECNKCNVLVYGLGAFFFKNEKRVNDDFNIVMFVDKYKQGYFASKQIVSPDKIRGIEDYSYIIIMIESEIESRKIKEQLIQKIGIPEEKIIYGCRKYGMKGA